MRHAPAPPLERLDARCAGYALAALHAEPLHPKDKRTAEQRLADAERQRQLRAAALETRWFG